MASDLRSSIAALHQEKWSRFLHWCCEQNPSACKATVLQIAEFFLHLQRELKLSFLPVKDHHAALDHVISLPDVDLVASCIISRMFCNFEKTCPPLEVKPVMELFFGSTEPFSSAL